MKFIILILALFLSKNLNAEDNLLNLKHLVDEHLVPITQNSQLIQELKKQNLLSSQKTSKDFLQLEKQWQLEISATKRDLINSVLDNAVSQFLNAQKNHSHGKINQIYITDFYGLNTAQSDLTPHYWQAHMPQFKKTISLNHSREIVMGEEHLNDITKTKEQLISLPIMDPENGQVLGALFVFITLNESKA